MDEVIIGNCRLIHGDCREVLPLLPPCDAVWTDPPYNVGMDYGTHNDNMIDADYESWCEAWIYEIKRIAGDRVSIYPPKYKLAWFMQRLTETHLVVCSWSASGAMHGKWAHQFAPILLATPHTKTPDHWHNVQMPGLGYFYHEDRYMHPGRTSDELTNRVLFATTKPGEIVLDPFLGSGTTAVSCANSGRLCIGIEIERKYFDIACRRIEQAYAQPRLFEDAKVGAGDTAIQEDAFK